MDCKISDAGWDERTYDDHLGLVVEFIFEFGAGVIGTLELPAVKCAAVLSALNNKCSNDND